MKKEQTYLLIGAAIVAAILLYIYWWKPKQAISTASGTPSPVAGDDAAFENICAMINQSSISGGGALLQYTLQDYTSTYAPGMRLQGTTPIGGHITKTEGLVKEMWTGNLGAYCVTLQAPNVAAVVPANGHTLADAQAAYTLANSAWQAWVQFSQQALEAAALNA